MNDINCDIQENSPTRAPGHFCVNRPPNAGCPGARHGVLPSREGEISHHNHGKHSTVSASGTQCQNAQLEVFNTG